MANVRKRILELTALESASLNTTIVGVDGGTTYKIELDTLADAVTARVNILDRDRLVSLESVTSSFETKGRSVVSSSAQITALGFISSSTIIPVGTISSSTQISDFGFISSSADITSLNSFTSSQSSLNTAFANGITARLQTSSFNEYTASQSTSSLVDRLNAIESVSGSWITESETGSFLTSLNGAISSSSQLTSSYDTRYTLSGSVQPLPSNLVSSSAQITAFGFISSSTTVDTGSLVTTSSFTTLSSSVDSRLDTLEASIITGSPNYTQVLGNRRTSITTTGVSIISGSITTTGNPVQIMVTGDANPVNVSSWTRLQIYRNETAIGNIVQVENSSNLNVPYCVNVIDTASAGTYTYSMRTVSGISGLFDFGESMGPTLTIVELNTNTNLPSTNNTFTGTNTFDGAVRFGTNGGDEGGEVSFGLAQTNSTLTGSVIVDVYRNLFRILESGGTARGVNIDLSKAPNNANGELMWKASGMVNAGTFVTLDNIKATVTSGSPYGLSIAAVSTNFSANISAYHAYTGGIAGIATNNVSVTTTPTNSLFNWSFPAEGDGAYYTIVDKTNNRMYRITMMIGASYNNNFISIERLF